MAAFTSTFNRDCMELYLDVQSKMLGTNVWWRINERIKPWVMYAMVAGGLAGAWVADYGHAALGMTLTVVSVVLLGVGAIIVAQKSVGPGVWTQYHIPQYLQKYRRLPPSFIEKIHSMRTVDPLVEYVITALERRDFAAPQGLILWQTNDRTAASKPGSPPEDFGNPILVLNAEGMVVEILAGV